MCVQITRVLYCQNRLEYAKTINCCFFPKYIHRILFTCQRSKLQAKERGEESIFPAKAGVTLRKVLPMLGGKRRKE